jgi:hypothetical protein
MTSTDEKLEQLMKFKEEIERKKAGKKEPKLYWPIWNIGGVYYPQEDWE